MRIFLAAILVSALAFRTVGRSLSLTYHLSKAR
jgi:hypothetical protein